MKSSIILFSALLMLGNVFCQEINPYVDFGYKTSKEYVLTRAPKGLVLTLVDSCFGNREIVINFKERHLSVISDSGRIINTFAFADQDFARFLSSDLLSKQYSMLSPYQYAANRPIDGVDLDGLEFLPFQKSMYRMQYATITSDQKLGNGQIQTITTSFTIVNSVYSNIPAALQDSKAKDFAFVSGGAVTAWGRDWDAAKDGALVHKRNKFYNDGSQFYGLNNGTQSPNPTPSTSGMGGAAVNQTRSNAANGAAGALGEEGLGVVANQFNKSTWEALTKEKEYRRGFYNATNAIDHYLVGNVKTSGKQLSGDADRVMLINFLTDGYLPTAQTDRFAGNEYSIIRKNAYEKQLSVAYQGFQIMKHFKDQGFNVDIQGSTRDAINDLLKKYKAEGGGNNFDNILKLMD